MNPPSEQIRKRAERMASAVLAHLVDELNIECPFGTTVDVTNLVTGELEDFRKEVLLGAANHIDKTFAWHDTDAIVEYLRRLAEGGE